MRPAHRSEQEFDSRLSAMGYAARISRLGLKHEAVRHPDGSGRWLVRPKDPQDWKTNWRQVEAQTNETHRIALMSRAEIPWGAIASWAIGIGFAAWVFWPRPPKASEQVQPPYPPKQMRSLGNLQLSAGDSLEAVLIPTPVLGAALCVVYRNSQGAQMQCLDNEVIDPE